jgi:hypothetical protein
MDRDSTNVDNVSFAVAARDDGLIVQDLVPGLTRSRS